MSAKKIFHNVVSFPEARQQDALHVQHEEGTSLKTHDLPRVLVRETKSGRVTRVKFDKSLVPTGPELQEILRQLQQMESEEGEFVPS